MVEGGFEVLGGGVGQQPWALGPSLDGAADGGEDALGREEVDAAVDEVGDVRLGLLDVVEHALRVRVRDNATKVGGGVVGDPRTQHYRLGILVLEQLEHLHQRERGADIGVEHKQLLGPALQYHVAEVVETARCAQRLVFAEVLNAQVRPAGRDGVDELLEDGLLVVADDEDLLDLGDVCDGAEAVLDYGVAGDGEERLE